MKKNTLKMLVVVMIVTVGINKGFSATVNNPMTEHLDGDAYNISNIAKLETADIITKGPQVDVRAYGAVGDGTTNDTVAIQNAFNSLSNGSTIVFPKGYEFLINDTLNFHGKENITIWGYGAKITQSNNTKNIIRLGNGAGSCAIRYTILGLEIDGDGTSGYGIGVDVGGGTYMQKNIIRDCYIYNVAEGIYLGGDYNQIINNYFENCTTAGIYNDASSYALISGNIARFCKDGINGQLPFYNRIVNNLILQYTNYGIFIGGNGLELKAIISNNVVIGSRGTELNGIRLTPGADYVKINGNFVARAGGHGIDVNGDDCTIENNTCHNNKNIGIIMASASRTMIRGNTCYNNGNGIIISGTGSDNFVSGNKCYDNQETATQLYGIVTVSTQTNCTIINNDLKNNGIMGISGGSFGAGYVVKNNSGVDDTVKTFTNNYAVPSVRHYKVFKTANSISTTITNFADGYVGQEILVIINDNNTTIEFTGTNLKGNEGVDWTPSVGDHMKCIFDGNTWYCTISDNTP